MLRNRDHITEVRELTPDVLLVQGKCPMSGELWTLHVRKDQIAMYDSGALAQVAFPTLNAAEREQLMTGHTQKGWDMLFPAEDR